MSNLQHWDAIAEERLRPAVGTRRIHGAGADLVRVDIVAGTTADRHSHDHEQFVQVVSGSGTLTTEAGAQTFSAGSVFHFPAGTWHAAVFDEATILVETNLRA